MPTILLVDDMAAVRFSISRSLQRAGYRVIEAADGQAALAALSEHAIDLIVTDLWMPNMDGVDLLKRLRVQFPDKKVVAISGGAPKAPIDLSAALATTWGADRVFYKPFDNEDLVGEIARLLVA